jgi:hypothetical protein
MRRASAAVFLAALATVSPLAATLVAASSSVARECTYYPQMAIAGHDLVEPVAASSMGLCCALCANLPGCVAANFNLTSSLCSRKSVGFSAASPNLDVFVVQPVVPTTVAPTTTTTPAPTTTTTAAPTVPSMHLRLTLTCASPVYAGRNRIACIEPSNNSLVVIDAHGNTVFSDARFDETVSTAPSSVSEQFIGVATDGRHNSFAWLNTRTFVSEWEAPGIAFLWTVVYSPRDRVIAGRGRLNAVPNQFSAIVLNATNGATLWNTTCDEDSIVTFLPNESIVVMGVFESSSPLSFLFNVYDLPTGTFLNNFQYYPSATSVYTVSIIGHGPYLYVASDDNDESQPNNGTIQVFYWANGNAAFTITPPKDGNAYFGLLTHLQDDVGFFAIDSSYAIVALTWAGQVLWRYASQARQPLVALDAVSKHVVYVAGQQLHALDRRTGAITADYSSASMVGVTALIGLEHGVAAYSAELWPKSMNEIQTWCLPSATCV